MRRINFLGLAVLGLASLTFTACSETDSSGSGKANIYLTDAPTDQDDISGVFISITKVELNGPEGWITVREFAEPKTINLLSYQEGDTYFLGDKEIAAGSYTEARLFLKIDDEASAGGPANPGCYLEFENGSIQPLFVPSGAESGYKAKGDFEISSNASLDVIMDFDVRKAVVKAGNSGKYLLKPTIRLVSNNKIGNIHGSLASSPTVGTKVVVFAYADGEFDESELSGSENSNPFDHATSSTQLNADGSFKLAFLNQGTYDLYFVSYDEDGNVQKIEGEEENVVVNALKTTSLSLDLEITTGL